ncbi:hypothetical protein HDU83_008157, partial [Entophlyctis luteolus]
MANEVLFVKYAGNQPVAIRTHKLMTTTGQWIQTLFNVTDVIGAVKQALAPRFDSTPADELTLHLPEGMARSDSGLSDNCFFTEDEKNSTLDPDCLLSALLSLKLISKLPLLIKSKK